MTIAINTTATSNLTLSSRDKTDMTVSSQMIAFTAGKSHAQVVYDIVNLGEFLDVDTSSIVWSVVHDSNGRQHEIALLPPDLAFILMSNYDAEKRGNPYDSPMRYALTKHCIEHEVVQIEASLEELGAYSESGVAFVKKTGDSAGDVRDEAVKKLIGGVTQMLDVMYQQGWIERDVY